MTTYDAECEGCEKDLNIDIDGYIGKIEGVWCEECGYEGENIPSEPVQEQPMLEWHEIRLAYEKMDPATPGRGALETILHFKDEAVGETHQYLIAANNLLNSIIGGRWK